jgi:23S rRNA pseudouridine2605 synthase
MNNYKRKDDQSRRPLVRKSKNAGGERNLSIQHSIPLRGPLNRKDNHPRKDVNDSEKTLSSDNLKKNSGSRQRLTRPGGKILGSSLSKSGFENRSKKEFPDRKKIKASKTFASRDRRVTSYVNKGSKTSSKSIEFSDTEAIRLNRFSAHSGICSRRQADEFIMAGLVSVNGIVVKEMGIKVKPGDVVKYNGETIRSERKVYILLNKPKDYVTSLDDEQGRKTVMDLIRDACRERVYPVGRLDRNTTGVMLFTNDGELTGKLSHPKFNRKKVYHVFLDKNLKHEDLRTIAAGITLDDGPIAPDSISYIDPSKKNEVGVEIHSGRNRIVRRIFESFGYKVTKLDRVYFAGLTKKGLSRGKWRFLSDKEIFALKMNSYE